MRNSCSPVQRPLPNLSTSWECVARLRGLQAAPLGGGGAGIGLTVYDPAASANGRTVETQNSSMEKFQEAPLVLSANGCTWRPGEPLNQGGLKSGDNALRQMSARRSIFGCLAIVQETGMVSFFATLAVTPCRLRFARESHTSPRKGGQRWSVPLIIGSLFEPS